MDVRNVDVTHVAEEVSADVLSRGWDNPPDIKIQPGMYANADPGLLRLLLENLVDNACKYSPNGGEVEIGSRNEQGETVFFVKDTGIGFDMQYEGKIFLPFERLVLETEFPGTGIGLANVHRIIKRHGGHISAQSKVGEGTTFSFTLGNCVVHERPPALEMCDFSL
jgi:signal transduction histidine kinase